MLSQPSLLNAPIKRAEGHSSCLQLTRTTQDGNSRRGTRSVERRPGGDSGHRYVIRHVESAIQSEHEALCRVHSLNGGPSWARQSSIAPG